VTLEARQRLADAEFENFVDGAYQTFGQDTYTVESPNGGRSIEIYEPVVQDVLMAQSRAADAVDEAEALSYEDRCAIVEDAYDMLSFDDEERAFLVEMLGMPRRSIDFKIQQHRGTLDLLPDTVEARNGIRDGYIVRDVSDEAAAVRVGEEDTLRYELLRPTDEPLSVFLPGNDPSVAPNLLGSAVLTGNTVVARPSSQEPYSTLKAAEALTEAGYPDGALNVVMWDNADEDSDRYRDEVVESCGACAVFGDDETVETFAAAADEPERPFLGYGEGRANTYVFADADLDAAVEGVVRGMTLWPIGCNATKAVRVAPDVYDQFTEKLVDAVADLEIGDPQHPETDIGYTDPEAVQQAEERANAAVVSSEDAFLYPEEAEGGLNGDRVRIGVPPSAADPNQMRPVVIEAGSEGSEFMQEEYPGYVLGVNEVPVDELQEHFDAAYTDDNGDYQKPIATAFYTEHPDEHASTIRGVRTHQRFVNDTTLNIDLFLRHQGIDLIEEVTEAESITVEQPDRGNAFMSFLRDLW